MYAAIAAKAFSYIRKWGHSEGMIFEIENTFQTQ